MSSDGKISVKEEIEKYRKERKRIREEFKAGSTFNIMEFIKSPEGIKALATGRLGIIEEHLNETGFMDDDFVGLNWSFKLDIGKKIDHFFY